jgi:hypothetical protein
MKQPQTTLTNILPGPAIDVTCRVKSCDCAADLILNKTHDLPIQ